MPVSSDTDNDKWVDKSDGSGDTQDWSALRALSFGLVSKKGNSIASCAEYARANDSPFFGVEKGTECWWVCVLCGKVRACDFMPACSAAIDSIYCQGTHRCPT